jgi:hypothetical protein
VRRWHDPQQSIPLLLKARACAMRGLKLSEAGNKRNAAKELRKAEELRHRARQPLGRLVT